MTLNAHTCPEVSQNQGLPGAGATNQGLQPTLFLFLALPGELLATQTLLLHPPLIRDDGEAGWGCEFH